jgi:hypothetical protein
MNMKLKIKVFENVQDQIGYCGIWCGSCIVGNGTLKELTKRYKGIIKDYDLPKWGPRDIDYSIFLKGFESMQNITLCSGCLKGGGRDNCEIRSCSSQKKYKGCHECFEQLSCKHSKILSHMRSGALKAGLFIKTEKVTNQRIIKNWTAKLKQQWPCLILFYR